MADKIVTKSFMSITELCILIGLSRARYYQLVRDGFLPPAEHDPSTNRSYYTEEGQRVCMEVRQRNCGVNQKPILFYSRRRDVGQRRKPSTRLLPAATTNRIIDLVDQLSQAKLVVTVAHVELAVQQEFPNGIESVSPVELFTSVRKRIQCQNSSDNAG